MTLIIIIVAAGLAYILCNMLYKKYWDRGLYAQVSFSRNQAVKDEEIKLIEVITNNKLLPLSMVRMKFQMDRSIVFLQEEKTSSVSDKSYKNEVFSLLFYQKITRTIPIKCQKRGIYSINSLDLVSTNLFMNANYVRTLPMYTEVIVYPRLCDMNWLDIPFSKIMGECMAKRYLYEDPFEFRGIREYQPYDAMSSVNWKASAKTGELCVNVHASTVTKEVRLMLNLDTETDWEEEVVKEECISIIAGLCVKLIDAGVNVSIVTNAKDAQGNGFKIEGGVSKSHIDMIMNYMARIDLKQKLDSFNTIIDEYIEKKEKDVMYVMVSAAVGMKLHEKYDTLCENNKNSLWIIPYSRKNYFEVDECANATILRCEVSANE